MKKIKIILFLMIYISTGNIDTNKFNKLNIEYQKILNKSEFVHIIYFDVKNISHKTPRITFWRDSSMIKFKNSVVLNFNTVRVLYENNFESLLKTISSLNNELTLKPPYIKISHKLNNKLVKEIQILYTTR